MKKNLLLLVSLCISYLVSAQTLNISKLDSLITVLSSKELAMGSLVISKAGSPQFDRAMGYAFINGGEKLKANVQTRYRIGSISKMFTAVMIFQMIEEAKLTLDFTLDRYFPDLPNANKITISNMLYHRSGLHDYTHDTDFDNWMDKPKTHEELLNIIRQKGTDFEPGTKADYCNTNYLLLGYIVEKISKTSYEDELKKRILTKAGLQNTFYGHTIDIKKNEAASYKYVEGNWASQKETDMSIHGGAGSIVSTTPDMIKFIEALFAGKLVSKKSLNKMKTMVDGYGMGMFPNLYGSKPSFGHNGKVEEFYSALWYFPGEKLSIAYVTNGLDYPREDIIEGLLKICFNEKFTIPFSKAINYKTNDLDKYVGKYSSKQLPFSVACLKEDSKLYLEAGGKKFEVQPINENYFMHAQSGTFFEFLPEKEELLIKESHNVYYTKKEK